MMLPGKSYLDTHGSKQNKLKSSIEILANYYLYEI
jgi:hypothetical protein